jgi:hypothetical protein
MLGTMAKSWDFVPLHERIVAGALEKRLAEKLESPESAREVQRIHEAADALVQACASFIIQVQPDCQSIEHQAFRIATRAIRKAIRQR